MLSLKDIQRHFGMRKTHEVLLRISDSEKLSSSVSQIAEDLVYINLVRRRADGGYELTDAGASALEALGSTVGNLPMQDHRLSPAIP